MKDFAAIDFETANGRRSSVCSVGVVVVRDGKETGRFYSLIRPVPDYYTYWTTRVHGLSARDTADAPTFPEVWQQIESLIEGLPLVAHNKTFDEGSSKPSSPSTAWNTQDIDFFAPCRRRDVCSAINCPTISSTPSPALADIASKTITTPSPTLKLVPQ